LSAALLPRLAGIDEVERRHLTFSSIQSVAVVITPALIGIIAATEPFFQLWIGADMAQASTPIAHVLAGGFWFYCLGHIAYSTLQASGRPDLVSKVLLAELLPFGAALMIGISTFGVLGAALAVTLRSVIDAFLFLAFAGILRSAAARLAAPGLMVIAAALAAYLLPWSVSLIILVPLLAMSLLWSAAHAPPFMQPYIERIRRPFSRVPKRPD
jgi:O-antigen/teichoic acid export membrane protein